MTEADLLQAVRDLARLRGFLVYHTHRSDRSEPGFPDVVCVHPRTGDVVIAELKASRGRVSRAQQLWLDALHLAGLTPHVWRPEHLKSGHVARALTPSDITARTA